GCRQSAYSHVVIKSFRHKALAGLFQTGKSTRIDSRMHRRIFARLDRLDAATSPEDMNLPGFNFHALRGFKPTRYTVHVNGSWCITFEFDGQDAAHVDLEQYH